MFSTHTQDRVQTVEGISWKCIAVDGEQFEKLQYKKVVYGEENTLYITYFTHQKKSTLVLELSGLECSIDRGLAVRV